MIIFGIYLSLLAISLKNYLSVYHGSYRIDYSWSWQYGYKQAAYYIKANYDKYDKIIMTKKYGEPHEFLLFYLKWNPKLYQNDPELIRFYQSEWYWVDRFDKLYFVNDWDIPTEEWEDIKMESGRTIDCPKENQRCLLITSYGNYPKGWSKLETINFLDGKPAFEILKNE